MITNATMLYLPAISRDICINVIYIPVENDQTDEMETAMVTAETESIDIPTESLGKMIKNN